MSKHSPGPWVVNGVDDLGAYVYIDSDCHVVVRCPDPGVEDANARLIAAAPDLLEALRNVVAGAEVVAALPTCREREVLNGLAAIARAALAKAGV